MKSRQKSVARWLVTLGVGGALLVGMVASAQRGECGGGYPCGCNPDGTWIICYDADSCTGP
jgi:hypothetical protein